MQRIVILLFWSWLSTGASVNPKTVQFYCSLSRLLLVLQCCIKELEEANGHKTVGPLTLGSTVRRLSKCMLKNTSRSVEMKEQVMGTLLYIIML